MQQEINLIIKSKLKSPLVKYRDTEYSLQDSSKFKLLEDLSALANHPSNSTKYIIIGVIHGLTSSKRTFQEVVNPTDQNVYQEFVDTYLEPKINFTYISFKFRDKKLAAFVISGNNDRPYLFKLNIFTKNWSDFRNRTGQGLITHDGHYNVNLTRSDLDYIYRKNFTHNRKASELDVRMSFQPLSVESNVNGIELYEIELYIDNLTSRDIDINFELRLESLDYFILACKDDITQCMNSVKFHDNPALNFNFNQSFGRHNLELNSEHNGHHLIKNLNKIEIKRDSRDIKLMNGNLIGRFFERETYHREIYAELKIESRELMNPIYQYFDFTFVNI